MGLEDRLTASAKVMEPRGKKARPGFLLLFSALAAASCAFLLLTGCPPKKKTKKALRPGTCKKDKDCGPKQYCVNGKCQQCAKDTHCKANERCVSGQCLKRCTRDTDCGPGRVCVDGACRTMACRNNAQCGPGRVCRAGKCEAIPKGLCREDDDCAEEEVCKNGRCVAAPRPGKPPTLCSLEVVYFQYNKATLPRGGNLILQRNAGCLRKVPKRTIQLEGHCDPRGTEEYNLALSNERAQTVKRYLVSLGIQASRFRVVPKGELEASGSDEGTWSKDRKVVFIWY